MEVLLVAFLVLVIVYLAINLIPRLVTDPTFANVLIAIVIFGAILVLIGYLPQVGWWHR